jgi:hypothetical protein
VTFVPIRAATPRRFTSCGTVGKTVKSIEQSADSKLESVALPALQQAQAKERKIAVWPIRILNE